jgi:hypothetical protein
VHTSVLRWREQETTAGAVVALEGELGTFASLEAMGRHVAYLR